ncbi:urea transporter [Castellaniella sp.]|uniref:urea transporter n=1 Tax=Castellaniella sp. TaxID=1955812 RepID=UPI0035674116
MASENNHFLAVCLRGAGQVFFMENALTGLLFIVAIAYASYDAGQWATTVGAIVGLLVATLTAMWMGNDKPSIQSGLFGFNGILVGVALPTFIAVSPQLWFYIIVGSAVSTVATAAFAATLTKSWGVPGSTGPFVLTAWLMVGGAYAFGSLDVTGDSARMASDYLSGAAVIPAADELVQIFFRNIAQVFLLGSAVSGVIILVGIFIASRPAGVAAALGSLVAMVCAIGMRVEPSVVIQGLYGFSPVLTAMAVGVIFLNTSGKVAVYALVATVATVFVQAAYDVVMSPLGLPSFTAPYVLTMYLFVAPKQALAPHAHKPVAEHQLHDH